MQISSRLVCAAALAFSIAAAPADAEAKCRRADGDVLPGYVLIVDGRVIYENNGVDDSPAVQADWPAAEDVFFLQIVCRAVTTGPSERPMRQNAIVIVTKAGVPPLVQAWLAEIVEAQRVYHASTGSYAGSVSELAVEAPLNLQLELNATTAGWSAATHISSLGTLCTVMVGSVPARRPEQKPGIPVCLPVK